MPSSVLPFSCMYRTRSSSHVPVKYVIFSRIMGFSSALSVHTGKSPHKTSASSSCVNPPLSLYCSNAWVSASCSVKKALTVWDGRGGGVPLYSHRRENGASGQSIRSNQSSTGTGKQPRTNWHSSGRYVSLPRPPIRVHTSCLEIG